MGLCVPGPPIYAYCSHIFFSGNKNFVALACQVALCEWLVQVAVAFVDAAYYGVREYVRVSDPRLYHDYQDKSCRGRLFHLPPKIIAGIRKLGIERIFAGCVVESTVVEQLLHQVEQTNWTGAPGFVWYHWEEDRVVPMPAYDGTDVSRFDTWNVRFGRWKRYWYTETGPEGQPQSTTPVNPTTTTPPRALVFQVSEPPAEPVGSEKSPVVIKRTPLEWRPASASKAAPAGSLESGEVPRDEAGLEVIEIKDEDEVTPEGAVKHEESEDPGDSMDLKEFEQEVRRQSAQISELLALPTPSNRGDIVATLARMVKYVSEVRQGFRVFSSFRSMSSQLRSVATFLDSDLETMLGLTPVESRLTTIPPHPSAKRFCRATSVK